MEPMKTIVPLIFLTLAFGFLLALRVVFLLVIRSGETPRTKHTNGPKPTVISNELFSKRNEDPNQ